MHFDSDGVVYWANGKPVRCWKCADFASSFSCRNTCMAFSSERRLEGVQLRLVEYFSCRALPQKSPHQRDFPEEALGTPEKKEEEYKGVGKTENNCAFAYWDNDDINDDGSPYISGPYCGCEKAKAPYGGGAASCGGPCEFWALRGSKDHRLLPATDEDYGDYE